MCGVSWSRARAHGWRNGWRGECGADVCEVELAPLIVVEAALEAFARVSVGVCACEWRRGGCCFRARTSELGHRLDDAWFLGASVDGEVFGWLLRSRG